MHEFVYASKINIKLFLERIKCPIFLVNVLNKIASSHHIGMVQ